MSKHSLTHPAGTLLSFALGRLFTRRAVLRATALLPAASCGNSVIVAQEVRKRSTIILLRPALRFEDLSNESAIPRQAAQRAEYERELLDAARRNATSKGEIIEVEKLEPAVAEACRQLQAFASRLAVGSVNDDVKNSLLRLGALDGGVLVLAQSLRLKVSGGSWNPLTGGVTLETNSTLLQASLASCQAAQVIWKNQQLVRKALTVTSKDFRKAIESLYQDFDVK